ncbi:MAG: T9SS type A sorting domain-containing protein [Saprospiraceae bacterium]
MKKILLATLFFAAFYDLTSQACLPGGVVFETQSQIDNFPANYPGCSIIQGDLSISDGQDILNLNGLSQIIGIEGSLTVQFNTNLSNLSGLNNLTYIGLDLRVQYNDALTNFIGINNLNSIGNYLKINNNPILVNLNGLNNLSSIVNYLTISDNPLLSDISDLANADITNLIQLYVGNCPNLSTCNIQSICDLLDSHANATAFENNDMGCDSRPEVVAQCLAVLPIDLINFQVEAENDHTLLIWQTASESANQGFDVQRSLDTKTWVSLTFIPGKGTSNAVNDYQFADYHPFYGLNYYRLKQIDFDGIYDYSKIRSIDFSENHLIQMYPNPVNEVVRFTGIKNGTFKIFDSYGKLIEANNFQRNGIDASNLNPGVYYIIVGSSQQLTKFKFIKI